MRSYIYVCLFFGAATWLPNLANASEIYLTVGQRQVLRVGSADEIRVRGPKVIHVESLADSIQITALQLGQAQIQVGTQNFVITVVKKSQDSFVKLLRDLLQNFLGLEVRVEQGHVLVDGELHRLSDWQQIHRLARDLNSNYLMKAKIDQDVQGEARAWISSLAHAQGLMDPAIEFLTGVAANLPDDQTKNARNWEAILNPLGVEIVYDKSQVAIAPLVRVRIVVAEINKKLQSQMGIEWPNMISAAVVPKLSGPTSLEVFLKAMEQNGLGQILASPNLLARSGSDADFLAGGEFAIKIITSRTREVIWKRHGIFLKIKPQADRLGRLSIELNTEVSLIDAAQSVEGVPALKTNRMQTQFDLTQARTIVLSGLIRSDWGRSTDGIMGFSQIPVLGALFRSQDFYNNRSELVIFVTPEIVKDEDVNSPQQLLPKDWGQHE